MSKRTATADGGNRWKCPDCTGWVRDDVDCHYCHAPVVITIPQPYPVPYIPYIPNTIRPYWTQPTWISSPTITYTSTTNALAAASN